MEDQVFREIARAAEGAGYRTDELPHIARALGADDCRATAQRVQAAVLLLLARREVITIRATRPDEQPGCYLVPADYSRRHMPGNFATPWEPCPPFGLPSGLDDLF